MTEVRPVFKSGVWDDSDHIVSVWLPGTKPWEDKPVGRTLDKAQAAVVASWLNEAWPELTKLLGGTGGIG